MQLHITHLTTALAVKLLFIKLQISVHVGIEFYITGPWSSPIKETPGHG